MVHICKRINMSRNFLYFLQILFFWVVSSVIRQKNGTKCQKIVCIHHHMVSFVVHNCKMMISPDFFFILFFYLFKILIFRFVRTVKGQKMSVALNISGTIDHDFHLYTCKIIISPGVFFFFIFSKL